MINLSRFVLIVNESYDHRTTEQFTEKARKMMISGEIIGPIASFARQLTPLEASDFLKTHVNAVHHTPYGLCMHDFAQTPCEKHLNCLANCKEYHRTLGDQKERRNLTQLQEQTTIALEHAKSEMDEGTWGASTWVNYHKNILSNIEKALAIDENNRSSDIEATNLEKVL